MKKVLEPAKIKLCCLGSNVIVHEIERKVHFYSALNEKYFWSARILSRMRALYYLFIQSELKLEILCKQFYFQEHLQSNSKCLGENYEK